MDPAGTRNCKVTWKSHSSEIANVLQKFRTENRFTDATILCSGITYAVHKVILASSSKYFKEVLSHADELHPCAHPIIVLNDIDKIMLETVLKFIYTGEVSVQEKDVGKLLDVANDLKIKGLSGDVLRTICLPKEVQGPITKDIECVENKSGETPRKRSLIDSTTVLGKTPNKRLKEAHERDFSDDNDASEGIIVDDTVTTDPVIPLMQSIHKEEPSASADREEEPSTCKDEALPQENKIQRNAGGRVLTGNADLDVQIKEEIIEDNYTPETIFLPCQAEAGGSGVKEETESPNNQGKSDHERLSESPSDCHNTSDEESKPLETSVGPVSSCSTARPTVTLDEKSAIPQELLPNFLKPYKLYRYSPNMNKMQKFMYWEQEGNLRLFEGIKQREITMKEAAKLVGTSYNSLYSQYSQSFGGIKQLRRKCEVRKTVNMKKITKVTIQQCPYCIYKSPYNHNLTKHLKTHTKKDSYKEVDFLYCDICSARFAHMRTLRIHRKSCAVKSIK